MSPGSILHRSNDNIFKNHKLTLIEICLLSLTMDSIPLNFIMATSSRLGIGLSKQLLKTSRHTVCVQSYRCKYQRPHKGPWPEEDRNFAQRIDGMCTD